MRRESFDVVVVGASIAGCTAATLFARQGLSVAVVEAHHDPAHYKRTCTHYIQSSATPIIQRLGLDVPIEMAGGQRNRVETWTRWGWLRSASEIDEGGRHGYNIPRKLLDPLIRARTAAEPGVEMFLGHTARGLLTDSATVTGVVTRTDGIERVLRGRLVVGADGSHSAIARLAGTPVRHRPHGRFAYFAAFENVKLNSAGSSRMWMLEPDVVYAFPNNDVTVLSVMPVSEKLPSFRGQVKRSFRRVFDELPDGPDLEAARQVSDFCGVLNYTCVSRVPTAPGLALVGDAAMVADYLWGVGCGFAFQSAELLVAATAGSLLDKGDPAAGLRRYGRLHRAAFAGHQRLMSNYATGRPFNVVERLMFSAAVRDQALARHVHRYGERQMGPLRFLSPAALARSAMVNARHLALGDNSRPG
jgi:menaquinone-9 beta-reductase